ncbi:MAG: hypothetical protein IPP66_19680 [Anaerolineales bacterium]|nr:hypothetical protein [Anaerolineales bacterium]
MRKEITTILKALDDKDPAVLSMEKKTMDLIDDQEDLETFIYNIKEEIRISNFIHSNRQPFYYLYSAIARIKKGDNDAAKNDLANAVQGFRISGFVVNEALAEWLFAIIHFENENIVRSQEACKAGLSLLSSLINECEKKGAYSQATAYKKYFKKIDLFAKEIETFHKRKNFQKPLYPSSHIRIPWIPVYDSVRAGTSGMIWGMPPQKSGMSVYTVEIGGKQHNLHPINKSPQNIDVNINLISGAEYGLARVKGHSMNASKPIPIEEDDYVLFTSSWVVDQSAIVIAGTNLTDQEISMMVKKYLANEKILLSETSDSDNPDEDYSPIQLTEEYQILGTVLAVAKPV